MSSKDQESGESSDEDQNIEQPEDGNIEQPEVPLQKLGEEDVYFFEETDVFNNPAVKVYPAVEVGEAQYGSWEWVLAKFRNSHEGSNIKIPWQIALLLISNGAMKLNITEWPTMLTSKFKWALDPEIPKQSLTDALKIWYKKCNLTATGGRRFFKYRSVHSGYGIVIIFDKTVQGADKI